MDEYYQKLLRLDRSAIIQAARVNATNAANWRSTARFFACAAGVGWLLLGAMIVREVVR